MKKAIGQKCWVVPDGFIPRLTEDDRDNPNGYTSHECACLLNAGDNEARIQLTVYFEDRDPAVVDNLVLGAQRCRHMRMDELTTGGTAVIDRGVPYALVVRSDEPIVVQMSRLDTTQPNMAFLSAMGYPAE